MTARNPPDVTPEVGEFDREKLTREEVEHYLRNHRDFFVHSPGLIETLAIPHETGEAVSLVERQVTILRDKIRELEKKLDRFIAIAGENEKASRRLHNLALKVMPINGFDESLAGICEQLHAEFPGTFVRIRLLDALPATVVPDCAAMEASLRGSGLVQELFSDRHQGVVFLNETQIDAVFQPGPAGQTVHSAASVVLKNSRHLGVMFLGSADACRYQRGIGTLFLECLGEIVSTKLQQFASG